MLLLFVSIHSYSLLLFCLLKLSYSLLILPWSLILWGRERVTSCAIGCYLGKLRKKQTQMIRTANWIILPSDSKMGQSNINDNANVKCLSRLANEEVKGPSSVIGVLAFPKHPGKNGCPSKTKFQDHIWKCSLGS